MRVFTGTIPDYATEVKGLLLGGVIGGGPAEQAGLQKGDVIVEIAGQTIANIYDYTYALELLKIGAAGEGRLHARRQAARDDADAGGAAIARSARLLGRFRRSGDRSASSVEQLRRLLLQSDRVDARPGPASARR